MVVSGRYLCGEVSWCGWEKRGLCMVSILGLNFCSLFIS
jgi:hypothetical protein